MTRHRSPSLRNKNVNELYAIAEERGVKNPSEKNRAQLMRAIHGKSRRHCPGSKVRSKSGGCRSPKKRGRKARSRSRSKCGAGKVRSRSTGRCRSKKKAGRKASFSPRHHHHHHFSPMKLRNGKKKTPAKHSRSTTESVRVREEVTDAQFNEWIRQGIKDGIFNDNSYRSMELPPGINDPNIRYWEELS